MGFVGTRSRAGAAIRSRPDAEAYVSNELNFTAIVRQLTL
jgi:hypothetical protein